MHISQVTRPWLDALDWIQRTGWRSRVHDVAVAKWIFDGWWQQVEKSCCASEKQNLCGFIEALEEVFHARGQASAIVLVAEFAERLGLRRVRMDDIGDRA